MLDWMEKRRWETMAEYIEREAAINAVFDAYADGRSAYVALEALPAADVRPVVRGKWTMNSDFPDRLICSECGAQFDVWHLEAKQMHFCPNCGAWMEES